MKAYSKLSLDTVYRQAEFLEFFDIGYGRLHGLARPLALVVDGLAGVNHFALAGHHLWVSQGLVEPCRGLSSGRAVELHGRGGLDCGGHGDGHFVLVTGGVGAHLAEQPLETSHVLFLNHSQESVLQESSHLRLNFRLNFSLLCYKVQKTTLGPSINYVTFGVGFAKIGEKGLEVEGGIIQKRKNSGGVVYQNDKNWRGGEVNQKMTKN